MPSYKKRMQQPAWGLYEAERLIATIRASTKTKAIAQFWTLPGWAREHVAPIHANVRVLPED